MPKQSTSPLPQFDSCSDSRQEYGLFSKWLGTDIIPDPTPSDRPAQLKALWEEHAPEWLCDDPTVEELSRIAHISRTASIEDVRDALITPVKSKRTGEVRFRYQRWDAKYPLAGFVRKFIPDAIRRLPGKKHTEMTRGSASLDAPLSSDGEDRRTLADKLSVGDYAPSVSALTAEKEDLIGWAREAGVASENVVEQLRAAPPFADNKFYKDCVTAVRKLVVTKLVAFAAHSEQARIASFKLPETAIAASKSLNAAYEEMYAARQIGLWSENTHSEGAFVKFLKLPSFDRRRIVGAIEQFQLSTSAEGQQPEVLASTDRPDLAVINAWTRSSKPAPKTPEEAVRQICDGLYSTGFARHNKDARLTAFLRVRLGEQDFSCTNAIIAIGEALRDWRDDATRGKFIKDLAAGRVDVPAFHPSQAFETNYRRERQRQQALARQVTLEDWVLAEGPGGTSAVGYLPSFVAEQLRRHHLSRAELQQLNALAKVHSFDVGELLRSAPLAKLKDIIKGRDGGRALNILAFRDKQVHGRQIERTANQTRDAGEESLANDREVITTKLEAKPNETWSKAEQDLALRGLLNERAKLAAELKSAGVPATEIADLWTAYRVTATRQPEDVTHIQAALSADKAPYTQLAQLCLSASREEISQIASGDPAAVRNAVSERITRASDTQVVPESAPQVLEPEFNLFSEPSPSEANHDLELGV